MRHDEEQVTAGHLALAAEALQEAQRAFAARRLAGASVGLRRTRTLVSDALARVDEELKYRRGREKAAARRAG